MCFIPNKIISWWIWGQSRKKKLNLLISLIFKNDFKKRKFVFAIINSVLSRKNCQIVITIKNGRKFKIKRKQIFLEVFRWFEGWKSEIWRCTLVWNHFTMKNFGFLQKKYFSLIVRIFVYCNEYFPNYLIQNLRKIDVPQKCGKKIYAQKIWKILEQSFGKNFNGNDYKSDHCLSFKPTLSIIGAIFH